jgi:hypothetical protein
LGDLSEKGSEARREESMETDIKDPTDYGLSHLGRGGSKKDRTMAKRAVCPPFSDVAAWGAVGRLLGLYDTRDRFRDLEPSMRESDVSTLRERLAELAECFNAKPLSKGALAVWVSVLKDHPIDRICDAISQWARTKTKFPAPAEIAGLCAARLSERVESESDSAKRIYAEGAQKILADPRIAHLHLAKIKGIFRNSGNSMHSGRISTDATDKDVGDDLSARELAAERAAIMSEDCPL